MKNKLAVLIALSTVLVLSSVGCATKKYARNRVNERVTPLEQRTGGLEETSRRNSQDIARVGTGTRNAVDLSYTERKTPVMRAHAANVRESGRRSVSSKQRMTQQQSKWSGVTRLRPAVRWGPPTLR